MNDLSIVIPVKAGEQAWRELLGDLLSYSADFEVLLVGPDFQDFHSQNNDSRVRYIYCKQGRALQQNRGAALATKSNIWFLHADSRLSNRSIQKVEEKLKENQDAIYFFDLNFLPDGPSIMFLNAIGAYWRSHLLKMPFGDQGFFMKRKTFFSLGMFNESAKYGEDHLFIWKARQRGILIRPALAELFTSARKYKNFGWITTTTRHLFLTYQQAAPEFIKLLQTRNKKKWTSAIAIFVKTPGVSEIKSRLAATIGEQNALEFYQLSLKATQAVVIEAIKKSEGKIEAYWAVAEKDQLDHSLWNSFKTIPQGSGDLGERLAAVYSKLQQKHRKVFLIGADSPHMPYKSLLKAEFKLISSSSFILGETEDGGFYLFGARGIIERAEWRAIPYSSEDTAAVLVERFGKSRAIFLERNFDIDYYEDLVKLADHPVDDLLPEQIAVINWAKKFKRE